MADTLWDHAHEASPRARPLAARMRPETVEDVVGQDHILGPGKLLRRAIEADRLGSILLYGPPGCGKTSLAEVIAKATRRRFERTSGVTSNVAALRELAEDAKRRKRMEQTETILFVDEIHRFSKSQQDVLLPYVEEGDFTLVGATSHNPFFFVNPPLLSRSQLFQLNSLEEADLVELLKRACASPKGLAPFSPRVDDDAFQHLARVCEGDGRHALNSLEIAVLTTLADPAGVRHVTRAVAEESVQKKAVRYDREDGHYDTISAFIKSVRGSDPHAAVYWLAKMLYAGEDPRFVARRLIILAGEDIGNADPRALSVATAAMQSVEYVGMPEARILLSQATTYLATAPKSNAAYLAIDEALEDVKSGKVLPVPLHLRDGTYKGAKELGHTGYQYAHDHPGHFVPQEYAPTDKAYYRPTSNGYEEVIGRRMAGWDARRNRHGEDKSAAPE